MIRLVCATLMCKHILCVCVLLAHDLVIACP